MSASDNIEIAKVCIPLVVRDIVLQKEKDTLLPRKLYCSYKVVSDVYNASYFGLDTLNNYLFSLCGGYAFEAQSLIGSTSGIVITPNSYGGALVQPYTITHAVTLDESGSQTLTDALWVGVQDVNQAVINQSVYQYGTDFLFNSLTGTFDFSVGDYTLQEGDVISALGFKSVPSTFVQGGSNAVTEYAYATSGDTITLTNTIGKTILLAFRSSPCRIITSGTPTTNELLFDIGTGIFVAPSSQPFFDDELIVVSYY